MLDLRGRMFVVYEKCLVGGARGLAQMVRPTDYEEQGTLENTPCGF